MSFSSLLQYRCISICLEFANIAYKASCSIALKRSTTFLPYATSNTFKGKAVPLQARRGPDGTRQLRFPDFVTTAQDGGKVVSVTHQPPLPPGNATGTHFC